MILYKSVQELRETEFIAGRKVPQRARQVHKQITNEVGVGCFTGPRVQSSVYLCLPQFLVEYGGLYQSYHAIFYIYITRIDLDGTIYTPLEGL